MGKVNYPGEMFPWSAAERIHLLLVFALRQF